MAKQRSAVRATTNKEMGDFGEKLVAAKLKEAGVLVAKMPVNNPGYDLLATPKNKRSVRISVKCRGVTSINLQPEEFDWMAVVLKDSRRVFVFPRSAAIKHSVVCNNDGWEPGFRRLSVRAIRDLLGHYENNFTLNCRPKALSVRLDRASRLNVSVETRPK